MGIPDHLTCLLQNLYAGQEAAVRTGHGTTDWFHPRLGQEALCQLLQVAGVVHLDLSLLTEEVLEVLQQLYPELTLLVQAFHLLCELSADLCNESKVRQSDRHFRKKP